MADEELVREMNDATYRRLVGQLARGRRVAALTATVLYLVALAGCGHSSPATPAPPPTRSPSTSPTIGSGSDDAADSTASKPQSVVVASKRVAYVLTGGGPDGTDHQALFASTDAGRSFHQVSAPTARLHGTRLPVSQLVFVDADDGYAVMGQPLPPGSSTLMSTTDGATSWHPFALPGDSDNAVAVAGHGDHVYAATITCRRASHCASVRLYSAVPGARTWQRTAGAIPQLDSGSGVALAAWDSTVWLMVGVGTTPHPAVLWSDDAARSFAHIGSVTAVSCSLVATSPRVMWSTCSTGMMLTLRRTDGGDARLLPVTGSGTGNTFLDPLTGEVAYFGAGAGRRGLYLTQDGGRSFHKVAGYPPAHIPTGAPIQTAFLDRRVALAVVVNERVLLSTDAGRTWRPIALPASTTG